MLHTIRHIIADSSYPRQFWVLFVSILISRVASSMTWPFITIFATEKLGVSLTTAALMLSVQSVATIAGAAVISPIMDQVGRRNAMILSILVSGFTMAGMALSDQIAVWLVLMVLNGGALPIFMTGVNAMIADILEDEQRVPAYALIRMSANLGIAVGPIIGGIVAQTAIEYAYFVTAAVYVGIAVIGVMFIRETMVSDQSDDSNTPRGYSVLLKDRTFVSFSLAYILLQIGYGQMFILLPIYSSQNFGLEPNEYSLIFSVNAAMVVLFQYAVTRFTMRFPVLPTIAVGALFYAAGIGSVARGTGLISFLLSMAIMTIGELIIAPTATAFVARIAPPKMRARYMSLFGVAFPIAMGIGPAIGGWLNDNIAPIAIWYGAGMMALLSAVVFFSLAEIRKNKRIFRDEPTI